MTHSDLCKLAVKWLKRSKSAGGHGCAVAVSECRSGWSGEIPDAIGFRASGHWDGSVVVEVKVSRGDFLADRNKPHRQKGGMGNWRYYMAPAGLINREELPAGWGLLEVNSRGHIRAISGAAAAFKGRYDDQQAELEKWRNESDMEREQFLLVRVLANTGDPQKVLGMLRESNNRNARLLQEVDRLREQIGRRQERYAVRGVSATPLQRRETA